MSFKVMVKSEPRGAAKGQFECRITENGLMLKQGRKKSIPVARGSVAKYLGKNRLQVTLAHHRLHLTVTKFFSYRNRLAKDLAAFINGSGHPPVLQDYSLHWYFYLLCALPLGIPIITLGGAVPAVLGVGVASACLGIAQLDEWSITLRVLVASGLVLAAYVLLFALLVIAFG